jgi:transcriptional regulator with XRE-family HTH domain
MQTGEDNNTPLERYLGITIRELRQRHGLTIAQVSEQAGISRGMLSKIENAQTSAGLDVLNRIAQALGVSLSTLFRNFDVPQGGAQLVKKGAGITMQDEAERFPVFQHPGTEFIHMLKGVIEYRHGQQTYILHPGDTLTFQGEIPHGPERLIKTPIQFLSIFVYPQSSAD